MTNQTYNSYSSRSRNYESDSLRSDKRLPRAQKRPKTIADIDCFIDTMELFSRKNPRSLIPQMFDVQRRRVWVEDVVRNGMLQGFSLKLNQPRPEALDIADNYNGEFKFVISRLHLAMDFDPRPDITREDLIEWIRTHTYLRYRRETDVMWHDDDRWYALTYGGRKTPASKNFLFYPNRIGKLDGEVDKIHGELRLEVARTIRNSNVFVPGDVKHIKPRDLILQHLRFLDTSPAVARSIRATIKANPQRDPRDIERYVKGAFKRGGLDEAMEFTRHFSAKRFSRLRPVFPLNVRDDLQWVRPGPLV